MGSSQVHYAHLYRGKVSAGSRSVFRSRAQTAHPAFHPSSGQRGEEPYDPHHRSGTDALGHHLALLDIQVAGADRRFRLEASCFRFASDEVQTCLAERGDRPLMRGSVRAGVARRRAVR